MKNFIANGETINITAAAAIASGHDCSGGRGSSSAGSSSAGLVALACQRSSSLTR